MSDKHLTRPPRWRPAALAIAAGAALAACAVGPNFRSPEAPQVADASHPYTPAALPAQTASAPGAAGVAQGFAAGQDVPADWWSLFGSPALDALVRAALEHNPTLAAAQASLREAQENYDADAGAKLFPSVNGQLQGERQRTASAQPGVPAGTVYNVFSASVDVSYTVDLFGANKREL